MSTAIAPKRERLAVSDHSADANLLDTARFDQMQRIAAAMAAASLIPDHLRAKLPQIKDPAERAQAEWRASCGNCLLVVNQAMRWRADPFAVAAESYVVRNKLGYQGKLVAAIVNTRANLSQRLSYEFEGSGDDLTVTVFGTFAGEDEPRTVTLSVKQAKTDNDMWRKDPEQKLVYSGAVKWARRHCPEVLLGVLTDDDLDRMRTLLPEPARVSVQDLIPATIDGQARPGDVQPDAEGAAQKPASSIEDAQSEASAGASEPPLNPPTPAEVAAAEQREELPVESDNVAWYRREAEAAKTLIELNNVARAAAEDVGLTDDERTTIYAINEARKEAIRATRGQRSGNGK